MSDAARAATSSQDIAQVALAAPGLIPPIFLSALLLGYSVLTFGARFANQEGRHTPRTGRALLYFGVVMLCLAPALLFPYERSAFTDQRSEYQGYLDTIIARWGLTCAGPLYLGWIIWRRRDRLIGTDTSCVAADTAKPPSPSPI